MVDNGKDVLSVFYQSQIWNCGSCSLIYAKFVEFLFQKVGTFPNFGTTLDSSSFAEILSFGIRQCSYRTLPTSGVTGNHLTIKYFNFLACPGNLTDPCSSHGKCDDGKTGTGHCECQANFTGTSCEKCIPAKYGRNCTNRKSESTCETNVTSHPGCWRAG